MAHDTSVSDLSALALASVLLEDVLEASSGATVSYGKLEHGLGTICLYFTQRA